MILLGGMRALTSSNWFHILSSFQVSVTFVNDFYLF